MRKTKSQQSNLPQYYYRAGAPQTGALPMLIAIVFKLEVPEQGYPLNSSPPSKSRKESQQGCSKKKAPSNSKLTNVTIKSNSTLTGVQPQGKANQLQCQDYPHSQDQLGVPFERRIRTTPHGYQNRLSYKKIIHHEVTRQEENYANVTKCNKEKSQRRTMSASRYLRCANKGPQDRTKQNKTKAQLRSPQASHTSAQATETK